MVAPVSPEVETELTAIYADMGRFFADFPRKQDFGYKIFNSPPLHRPRVLFIGYQPSGGAQAWADEAAKKTHLTWPEEAEYATAFGRGWTLAPKMRKMFEGRLDLRQCVGTNAIFLRSPDIDQYKLDVAAPDRKRLKKWCEKHVMRIIDLLEPESIVCIGLDTLYLFSRKQPPVLCNEEDRALARPGKIGRHTTTGFLHFTGSRIADPDLLRMADFIVGGGGDGGDGVQAAA